MRILVLGGTSFVGRAIARDALAGGHDVTLFNRGTVTGLFPGAGHRRGDRSTGDYAALAHGSWDAVVDVSAYVPRHVRQAADALGGRVGRYLLISTVSVYDLGRAPAVLTEDAPRLAPERGTEDSTSPQAYGALKVACEDDVLARYGGRATLVRPGIVAGPHDPTDRFTWWVRRAARGGAVALPGRPDQPVQVVDSGDLAALVTALVAADRSGTYNAVGPEPATTLAGLAAACAQAAGTTVDLVPVEAVDRSAADGAVGGDALPLVVPEAAWSLFRTSAAPARAAGLAATPLTRTAADVLAWDRGRGRPAMAVGISAAREAELLAVPPG